MQVNALLNPNRFRSLLSAAIVASLALVGLTGLTGCSSAQPAQFVNPAEIPTVTYRAAFVASMDTLVENGYRLDRKDYRFGKISSKPERSPSVLEVWKPVNTTAKERFGSTIGAWRRVVKVSIEPQDGARSAAAPITGRYDLAVRVELQRRHSPLRRMSGAMRSYEIFSTLTTVPTEMSRKGIRKEAWHAVGRDEDLEQHLLLQIIYAMGLPEPELLPVPVPAVEVETPVPAKPVANQPAPVKNATGKTTSGKIGTAKTGDGKTGNPTSEKGKRDPLSDIDLIGE